MDIIHADDQQREIGFVQDFIKLDATLKKGGRLTDNTYQLTMDAEVWERSKILRGHYLYIPGEEWGGPVEDIRHSTAQNQITLKGPTWRGLMARKVVEPPEGEAYFVIEGIEANAAIAMLIGDKFGDLVAVDTASTGRTVAGFIRYRTLDYVFEYLLDPANLRLYCRYDVAARKLLVGAEPVTDLSYRVDLSQDYGVNMLSREGRLDGYNHIIALGRGELEEREVQHLFRSDTGLITQNRPIDLYGIKEQMLVYDYPNAESSDELIQGAVDKLQSYVASRSVEIDTRSLDMKLELGDVVGARDRLTGLSSAAIVTEKILTITSDNEVITTKTEWLGWREGEETNELTIESITPSTYNAPIGTEITWFVEVSGGTQNYSYEYLLHCDGQLVATGNETDSSEFAVRVADAGEHVLTVIVRDGKYIVSRQGGAMVAHEPTEFGYTYTGSSFEKIVTYAGVEYRVITLVTSGVFKGNKVALADIWMCGGGSGGTTGYGGKGGNFLRSYGVQLYPDEFEVTIGYAGGGRSGEQGRPGGPTKFGEFLNTEYGIEGSGAGRASSRVSQTGPHSPKGGGVSTVPFGDADNFKPHCAGGGGAGLTSISGQQGNGGDGGTDGGDAPSATKPFGLGGVHGGGDASSTTGYSATSYGGGGGGGGGGYNGPYYSGGNGRAGVCYIRIRNDI